MNKIFLVFFIILAFYAAFVGYSDFNKVSENISNFKFEFLPIILLLAFTAFFIAPFIRSLIDFDWRIEILITTSIIIPIYILAKRYLLSIFIKKD